MCFLILISFIGAWVLITAGSKLLVVSKIISLPLEVERYEKFKKKLIFIEYGCAIILGVPLLMLYLKSKMGAQTPQEFWSIFVMVMLLFMICIGIENLLGMCPRCSKIFTLPIKGIHKRASHYFEDRNCPVCGFNFESKE